MKPAVAVPDPMPQACANCGQPFAAPPPAFCPACGQESRVRPPRLLEFLQQFGGAYLSTEGALWRTLKLLLFKPGELTARYLAGQRKHFVLPLRLYLTISLLVLLLLRLVTSLDPDLKPEGAAQVGKAGNSASISIGGGRAGLRDGVYFCEDLPAWACKRLKRRLDIDPKRLATEVDVIKERFLGNLGAAMFLLLPSFALWLKLVYWSRRLHYTEHLVFALHVHTFWFLGLALTLSGVDALAVLALLLVPGYTLLAMKRVYGGRWWPRLLRAGLVSLLYLVVLGLALVGVGLFTLLS